MTIHIERLTGDEMPAALSALARLRISEFLDWPYLYNGTLAYEETYLRNFASAQGAVIVVARNGDDIVGVSTGAPLTHHQSEFGEPFKAAGLDIGRIYYFGESVLNPRFRGNGIGHRFFDEREAHARSLATYTHATFCSVVRPDDHPDRPPNALPLDAFWNKRGYTKIDGLVAHFAWPDVGALTETSKPMQFWMRPL